jgi:phage-related protein
VLRSSRFSLRKAARGQAVERLWRRERVELIEDHDGNTYRAVYTVRFGTKIYVLHAFQKKSKHGIATPKHEIELIRVRLKIAERMHGG